MELLRIELTFACAGVYVDEVGIVTTAAPIFRGWVGQPVNTLIQYYRRRTQFVSWYRYGEDYAVPVSQS